MLFVDVRGSTGMAENVSPRNIAKLINRFYRAATEEFYHNNGFVEKLLGDEVAGFFVPGFAGPEHAKVAVDTGKRIMKAWGTAVPPNRGYQWASGSIPALPMSAL